jgi:bifunctional non-homologous end joining protein LigD
MPGFIKPQLATLKSKAPNGDQWLHEIKYDGYRVQLHVNSGKKEVCTRNGLDWTKRFSLIAGAFDIPGQAIIDGEVVVIHERRTNFSELQAELAAGRQDRLVYQAFDLLWLNGQDFRNKPQLERKAMLQELFDAHEPAPLPAVYAAADEELVCVLGPLTELNYPMFLLAHRRIPRANAVFEFCLSELKSVLTRGEMKK